MSDEMDIIQHLLDIEREASRTLIDAQTEADAKITAARTEAEKEFKARYSELVAEIDRKANDEKAKITEGHDTEIRSFKDELHKIVQDKSAFNGLLEKLLYA
ncbi:MAG: hypothetical protein ILP07_05050 [Treponema sp.]|nr:hypothetical protein [Treponema sp.]